MHKNSSYLHKSDRVLDKNAMMYNNLFVFKLFNYAGASFDQGRDN